MDIVQKGLGEISPYENNPRVNDEAVDAVAASIKEFGFKVPIVIDGSGVIVAGHTRYRAAKKLGMEAVPCIVADDLSEEQIRAFRLADNKTAELASWDEERLAQELAEIADIDMTLFGFDEDDADLGDELLDNPYTMATNVPQYEPTGKKPSLSQLYDTEKTDDLIAEIEASGLSKEEKGFLLRAAGRHTVFNYGLIPGERDIPENLLFSHVHAVLYQGRDDVQQEQPDTPPHRLGVLRPQDTEREIPKGEIASCRA